MYDSYIAMCRTCGAKLVPIPFTLPDLGLPRERLAAAFNPRTKFILVNTPHNPTGKVRYGCAGSRSSQELLHLPWQWWLAWIIRQSNVQSLHHVQLPPACARPGHCQPRALILCPMRLWQVFTRDELQFIADLCIQHDSLALLDEVYEHLVLGAQPHITLRSLPDMQERCLRLGSAGKTFSFTAWKV